MKKQEFVVVVGVPGSGKTTWANEYAASTNGIVVSSDDVRVDLWGDASIQKEQNKVFAEVHRRVIEGLKAKKTVIMDATNLHAKWRKALIRDMRSATKMDFRCICAVIATLPEVCIARQEQRDRKVPAEVIRRYVTQFQVPFYNEGWDDIWIVKGDSMGFTQEFEASYDLPQDCKWHDFTIREHCRRAGMWFDIDENRKRIETLPKEWADALSIALPIHDIGKFRTKTFVDKEGVSSQEAHFYNHDTVGTYLWLCNAPLMGMLGNVELVLRVALIIQYHMLHYSFKDDWNEIRKWAIKRGFDEDFANALEMMAAADKYAQKEKKQ